MTNKQVPGNADERTQVIKTTPGKDSSVNGNQSPAPASPAPFASLFSNGKSKTKRTIVAGAISGGMLAAFLSVTSFSKKGKDQPLTDVAPGNTEDPAIAEGDMVAINTAQGLYSQVHEGLSLEEVREIAREHIGPDGVFVHEGQLHFGISNDEWAGLSSEQRLEYFNNSQITPATGNESLTVQVEINGRIVDVHIDPVHRGQAIQEGWDDDGNFYVIPEGQPAFIMDNVVHGSDGLNYWVNPENGERHVFNIVEVYQQINEHGAATLQTYVPGNNQPVFEGDYIYSEIEVNDHAGVNESDTSWQEGWGWDTDRDGLVDRPDPNEPIETWATDENGNAILQWVTYPDGHIEYPEIEEEEAEEEIDPAQDETTADDDAEVTGQVDDQDVDVDQEVNGSQTVVESDPDAHVNGELVDDNSSPTETTADTVVMGEILQDEPGEVVNTPVETSADEDQPVETDTDYSSTVTGPGGSYTDTGLDMNKDSDDMQGLN